MLAIANSFPHFQKQNINTIYKLKMIPMIEHLCNLLEKKIILCHNSTVLDFFNSYTLFVRIQELVKRI
jgi:hypothetical protein